MNGDLKQTFILHVLQETLGIMDEAMVAAIRKNRIGSTDNLKNSIRTRAEVSGAGARGQIMFDEHGRFVDMGVGRKYPLGGLKAVTETLLSSTQAGVVFKKSSRRPKKWYSKVVYSKLNYLENKLMYGFTEEARKELLKMQPKNAV